MKKAVFISIFLWTLSVTGVAQRIQFSQFYASPMILAPSYTGSVRASRLVLNYRNQWPVINEFVTFAASYDQHFPKMKSGLGVVVMRDQAGTGNLARTDLGFSYSWYTEFTKNWFFRPGIMFKYSNRSVDFYKLTFGDQINPDGTTNPISSETPPLTERGYLDVPTSALVYSPNYWGGVAFDNLLRPDESLFLNNARVPVKISVFGGTKIPLSKGGPRSRKNDDGQNVSFSFLYKYQGKADQLDLGSYWSKDPFTLGLWFRGLPIISNESGAGNLDAIILLIGYKIFDMRIGYSYDFTVSNLISSTGGSHEISIIYEFTPNGKAKKRHAVISCPKF